jgi:anti-sigma factor RsiW
MSLVLDDEATEAEAARLREHVGTCETCRETWRRWQELDRRFALAPVFPAPMDFAAAVSARLDQHAAEQVRRRWLMIGLGLAGIVVMLTAVVITGVTNGWLLSWISSSGWWTAAWAGLTSSGGILAREALAAAERLGAPTLAAVAGALLCVACGLGMMWLWMMARLSPNGQSVFARD